MQVRNTILVSVAVVSLVGCGSLLEREVDYKAGAAKSQPLEVPPGMTAPETDSRYTIPGKTGEKVASYSEYSKQKAEQPCTAPVVVPAAAPVPSASAKLQENDGVRSIQLGEPFDRSWRRISLALEKARIVTTDKDRSKGIYFLVAAPDKDKKKQPDYQLIVRENAEGSEVTVVDQAGKSNAETVRLIDLVYKNLDKNGRVDESYANPGDAVRRSR